tara:strand:- start:421 stop:816 length:396 start_codon:yes stop_codon:yes gene_type:complete
MSIYDSIGINYNKGTKRVNSISPGCTIEYEADIPKERVRKVYERPVNPYEKYKPTESELLQLKRVNEPQTRDAEPKPGYTIKITPMEDKELDHWPTGSIQTSVGDIPKGFCIAPAYNKGAYQVIPSQDTEK